MSQEQNREYFQIVTTSNLIKHNSEDVKLEVLKKTHHHHHLEKSETYSSISSGFYSILARCILMPGADVILECCLRIKKGSSEV